MCRHVDARRLWWVSANVYVRLADAHLNPGGWRVDTGLMATFLIHLMGEENPRPTVCASEEEARHLAALLGIRPRCYTIVRGEGPAGDALPHVD